MKKVISILLALVMLVSIGTVLALAADDFTLTVKADKAEAAPGEEVTFTFTLAGSGKYDCISFKVEADSGLDYVSSETGSGFGTADGAATVSFDNKNGFYMFSGIGTDIAAGKLFSVKYKVKSAAAAGSTLNVKVATDKTGTSTYSNKDKFILSYNNVDKTCSVTNGSVKVKSAAQRGDFNGDNKVTDADAVYLLRYTLLGADKYPISQSGDVNGDGKVTDADAVYLLRYTLLGGDKYPLH